MGRIKRNLTNRSSCADGSSRNEPGRTLFFSTAARHGTRNVLSVGSKKREKFCSLSVSSGPRRYRHFIRKNSPNSRDSPYSRSKVLESPRPDVHTTLIDRAKSGGGLGRCATSTGGAAAA